MDRKKYQFRFVWIIIPIVLSFILLIAFGPEWLHDFRAAKLERDRQAIVNLPFRMTINNEDGQTFALRETYSTNNHLISDIGDVRIAITGITDTGWSRDSILIDYVGPAGGFQSSTGVGLRRFETRLGESATLCSFGGVDFQFRNSELHIDGHVIPVNGNHPHIVFVELDGTVSEIVKKRK
ncbi:MAG: hypothetical protein AAGH99_07710 [Planctomycetota bacterium]